MSLLEACVNWPSIANSTPLFCLYFDRVYRVFEWNTYKPFSRSSVLALMTTMPIILSGDPCSLITPQQKLLFRLPYREARRHLQQAQDSFISRFCNDEVKFSHQPVVREPGSAGSERVSAPVLL